jgi:hypothetical protein
MKYEIWQLKHENLRAYGFMDYEWACEHGFSLNDYEKTYDGELEDNDAWDEEIYLELLFKIFNVNRPEDFKGHSLSVSDIVSLNGKKFYCDSWSWKKL